MTIYEYLENIWKGAIFAVIRAVLRHLPEWFDGTRYSVSDRLGPIVFEVYITASEESAAFMFGIGKINMRTGNVPSLPISGLHQSIRS
jgi:hypothetical protein